jgi:hypothetical protein
MEQHKNEYSELDVHKYYGKNADYVTKELEKQSKSCDAQMTDYLNEYF